MGFGGKYFLFIRTQCNLITSGAISTLMYVGQTNIRHMNTTIKAKYISKSSHLLVNVRVCQAFSKAFVQPAFILNQSIYLRGVLDMA